ncbi:MAG TPA: LysR substrate-binding domain-containing protein [Arenimonas sp.]|uniref:LysR substrate-binding domain-containing protein n=1 Tax=Arenimonas sp. TaxID=1872635 RepID=UPI002B846662|nr:LysR substrate-binding domain-containing protein [Arenimonas sp.]HMB55649.1 LysR substrate-binding domain-containing protein [Arenimonas sp.]
MGRLPLTALEGFLLAARLGNLSRAATQLNLTVSALSHQMRGLEERLGQRLLVRGSRGVSLTAEGERLLEGIALPFAAIERALRQCQVPSDDILTLSLMPSMASSWLLPRLPDFLAAHPELQINLQSNTTLVNFDQEPVDVAIRFGAGQWPGLTAEHLFDEWLTPVASPALIAKLGRTRLRDLSGCPLLGDPGGRWTAWFARFGGTPPTRFVAQFSDSEPLHRAAVEGLGIALGRMTMARPLVDTDRLRLLGKQRLRAEFSHYLVYPPRSEKRQSVRLFRDWLLLQAREYAVTVEPRKAGGRKP